MKIKHNSSSSHEHFICQVKLWSKRVFSALSHHAISDLNLILSGFYCVHLECQCDFIGYIQNGKIVHSHKIDKCIYQFT